MCGRYGLFAELDKLAEELGFPPHPARLGYRASWNIAPSMPILAVSAPRGEREAGMMRWGMSPAGGRGPASRLLFNARSETLSQRPSFRSAFEDRRCLIPANGFYEWQPTPDGKAPVWLHREDEFPLAFAGLYGDGAATIITTDANSFMRPIHHRMPTILSPDEYESWLDSSMTAADLRAMLTPREWPEMAARPVGRAVNRAGTDGPELIEAAETTRRLL